MRSQKWIDFWADVGDNTEPETREIIQAMIELLDDADMNDYFGTEGWRHNLGLDE